MARRPDWASHVSACPGWVRRLLVWPSMGILALSLPACGDDAAPTPPPTDPAGFVGSIDPSSSSFVLHRVELTGGSGASIPVELLGSDLEVDAEHDLVRLNVALRNAGAENLYAPALVWVSNFLPASVRVTNASHPIDESDPMRWGFDYTGFLEPPDVLLPGTTSRPYRWRIYDPGLLPFSFGAEVEMRLDPPPAVLSGGVFEDLDQNGVRERNEGPWRYGQIRMTEPDGTQHWSHCDEAGAFRFFVDDVGLFRLQLESLVDCPVCFTTPNPLEVVLTPGFEGQPQSFGQALFGAVCGACNED